MWRKGSKFLALSTREKLLLLESFLYLGWARILKGRTFSKVAPSLGTPMQETPMLLDQESEALILAISSTVNRMSHHTPWESKCYVTAVACMKMLERRGIGSTLYMGTAKDQSGKMIAHAWLRSGPHYLTGMDVMEGFTVVGIFGKTVA
ncbi:lasso peptide biosynthesis B2 protein [Paenibacillus solisilvae]|uniref:Lasso peptide biosynthesis B2 protein n=1 Tax=Paenibacillus solisilvae TaxID=2486751 RepID=A0ABW0WBU1_9BACL